jgi:phospholipid/cholesterol/gamma-HCH transport system substrate-binding protein
MKFRIKNADKIVGIFIIAALIGLVSIIIFLGINQRWFARNWHYYSIFHSASGLNRGMVITFKGFAIGKIDTVELNDENEVILKFYVFDEHHEKVNSNTVLELAVGPLSSSLQLYPGKEGSIDLPEDSYVPSLDTEEGKRLVKLELVIMPEKSEDSLSSILASVDEIVSNIDKILNDHVDEIDEAVVAFSEFLVALNDAARGQGKGPLNTMFVSTAGTLRNINYITGDPKGMLTKLLDPEVTASIQRIVENLEEFSRYIRGTAPQITSILEKGHDALDEGRDVLEAIKNNPLLSGGVTEEREQPTTIKSFRDEAF